MTTHDSIRTDVHNYLEEIKPGILSSDEPLQDDAALNGFLDSFDMFNLIEFLAGQFSIEISDTEASEVNFGTVDAIVTFVSTKVAQNEAR